MGDVQTYSRTALQEVLLANARKSLNETAELTGIKPQELAVKYAELFEDRGWLSTRQEERLLIIEIGDLLDSAKERLTNASDENYASVARVVLGSMTLMAQRFDQRKKLVDDDINQITAANARMFGKAFDIALSHIVSALKESHPEIEDEEANMHIQEGLKMAQDSLSGYVQK